MLIGVREHEMTSTSKSCHAVPIHASKPRSGGRCDGRLLLSAARRYLKEKKRVKEHKKDRKHKKSSRSEVKGYAEKTEEEKAESMRKLRADREERERYRLPPSSPRPLHGSLNVLYTLRELGLV